MSDRLALIIANSEFDDPRLSRLTTPERDAVALARALSDANIGGFEVTLLINKSLQEARREIARLYQRRKRGDLLLLYYSGHGIKDDFGDLYLAAQDTETEIVSATALGAAFVREQLDKSGSQRKVVVLDCCHSGAFARGGKAALGGQVGAGEAFAGSGYGRVVLTASNAVEYAWEGDELLGQAETSVFTRFLVQGLNTGAADRDASGEISVDEWYDYAYEQIVSGAFKQTPQKWAQKVEGNIVIARNPHHVVKPAGLPPELSQAVESPFAGLREGAVRELERLLRGSDEGQVQAAREALERLTADDSRRVSSAAASALDISEPVAPKPETAVPIIRTPVQRETRPAKRERKAPFDTRQAFEPEMILIPAGEFLMGSDPNKDKDAQEREQPQHTLHLPDYYLAKTPVTNAQYAAFVQAARHDPPKHWKDGQLPGGKEDHPVVFVSWYDALAYCHWLSEATGRPYALPSEAEWEKGARGSDGRIYPWGDNWDAKLCNSGEGGKGDTTPVGAYSQGASPYGLLDMAGNVWEWTRSLWGEGVKSEFKYPYDTNDGRENLKAGYRVRRVLRGTAFVADARGVRCASRGRDSPHPLYFNIGFRVVLVAAPFSHRLGPR